MDKISISDLIARSVPTKEEFAQMEYARIHTPTKHALLLQNTLQLSKWLERCKASGIPAVPAVFSDDIQISEIFDRIDGKLSGATLSAAAEWLKTHLKPGYMWRWEQCAGLELKSAMAHGQEVPNQMELDVDDPRLCDILYEVALRTTKLAVRPIVPILRHKGYPVEFRCYVAAPGQVAVSNYYPQTDLTGFETQAQQAGELALKLYPYVNTGYTADFCLSNGLLFLEGGPPWGAGAHPCCFNPEQVLPGRIVLKPEPGNMVE
jgi:hypothetical protein